MTRTPTTIPTRGRCIVLFVGNDCPYCGGARKLLGYACAKASVNIFEVNAQSDPKRAALYHVQSVPTAIKVSDGKVKGEIRERMLAKALEKWVSEW